MSSPILSSDDMLIGEYVGLKFCMKKSIESETQRNKNYPSNKKELKRPKTNSKLKIIKTKLTTTKKVNIFNYHYQFPGSG